MPRQRRAARPYRKPQSSVHDAVRKKFAPDTLEMIFLKVENFHRDLPTEAERRAFLDIYPERFYDLFEFESSAWDQYPASDVVATGSCVFRRTNFATEFLKANPPRTRFNPPDLRDVRFFEQQPAMARARGEWWKANNWEMTDDEHRFMIYGPTPRPVVGDPGPPPLRRAGIPLEMPTKVTE